MAVVLGRTSRVVARAGGREKPRAGAPIARSEPPRRRRRSRAGPRGAARRGRAPSPCPSRPPAQFEPEARGRECRGFEEPRPGRVRDIAFCARCGAVVESRAGPRRAARRGRLSHAVARRRGCSSRGRACPSGARSRANVTSRARAAPSSISSGTTRRGAPRSREAPPIPAGERFRLAASRASRAELRRPRRGYRAIRASRAVCRRGVGARAVGVGTRAFRAPARRCRRSPGRTTTRGSPRADSSGKYGSSAAPLPPAITISEISLPSKG